MTTSASIQMTFDELTERAKKAETEGTLVGRYLSFPVADGKAFYVVTKENTKSVRIQHVFVEGTDGYHDVHLGLGGLIDKEWVKSEIAKAEMLRRIFSSP